MDSSSEGASELDRLSEIDQVISELRGPFKDLTTNTEELRESNRTRKPAQLLGQFISENSKRLSSVLKIIKRQASRDRALAQEAVKSTLTQEAELPPLASEIVSQNLVAVTLADNTQQIGEALYDTLEATTFNTQDREHLVDQVEEPSRELVLVQPTEGINTHGAEEDEGVEYVPPSGSPDRPPGRRRRFSFGRGGGRERTREEALGRRRRLPRLALAAGAGLLALAVITGKGEPWKGWPAKWVLGTLETTGGLTARGTSSGLEGFAKPLYYQGFEVGDLMQDIADGEQKAPKALDEYIQWMVEARGSDDDMTLSNKDKNIISDRETWNDTMIERGKRFDDLLKREKIEPDGISDWLQGNGYDEEASYWTQRIHEVFLGKPLTDLELTNFRLFYTGRTNRDWNR